MIILDTNIISELMRPAPDANVLAWIDDPELPETATTAISLAEIGYGIAMLPEGRRKCAMQDAAETFFHRHFGNSTLPFDTAAAALYAELAGDHRRAGRPVGILDLQIAAICHVAWRSHSHPQHP